MLTCTALLRVKSDSNGYDKYHSLNFIFRNDSTDNSKDYDIGLKELEW